MRSIVFLSVFSLVILTLGNPATAATRHPYQTFSIRVPGWTATHNIMPGVLMSYYPKAKRNGKSTDFAANINVIKDDTAGLDLNLESYVKSALAILVEQKTHVIHEVKMARSRSAKKYYVIFSSSKERSLLQGVYHRPGQGFYVVTATCDKKDFAKYKKRFYQALGSGRFL